MVQVQVIEHGSWARAAAAVQERELELAPRRGAIYDRDGTLLAFDVKAVAIAIDSFNMTRPVEITKILSEELKMSTADATKLIYRKSYFTWIKRQVDLLTAKRIEERAQSAGAYGLIFLDAWKRHYPQGRLASNLIGFVGADGEGLEGLELQYDELLRGVPAIVHIVQGADGRTYQSRVVDEGTPGKDLHLTLDATLQLICEEEIATCAGIYNPLGGFVIALDPNTGEVLAMAQDKTYDLNSFGKSTPSQRQNLAVTLMFEPGSIFKAVSGLSAVEAGVVTPDTLLQGKDGIEAGGHTIHNAGRESFKPEANYRVTFRYVIEKSINTGIVDAALRLKKEPLHRTMSLLGFGSPTGIDLPGESTGILRPAEKWTDLELATAAFGQSVGVTGIQLARGLSVIANGGYLVTPHIVQPEAEKKRKSRDGDSPPQVVSAAACATMRDIMTGVVDHGTGKSAISPGLEIAGKTGTAQKAVAGQGYVEGKYTTLFGCFVPADVPELVFLVILDEPKHPNGAMVGGGSVSAPVFHEIMWRWLQTGHFVPPDKR
jgi:cell division protein FtsI/penicillin-binding protein 2